MGSPVNEEWFRWAPEAATHWLLALTVAAAVAPAPALFPLVPYLLLPAGWRRRLPVRFLPFGSPPHLGAAVVVVLADLPVALMAWLAATFGD